MAETSQRLQRSLTRNPKAAARPSVIAYSPRGGVDDFVARIHAATPMQMVAVERHGVGGRFFKDVSRRMEVPAVRMFSILGVAKATVEKKSAANTAIKGSGGQAAIGMARLLAIARRIVDDSTAAQAKDFDAAKWLGKWIERPQPSLGGRSPAELIDTPTGVAVVARLLGAIESGAFQ